MVPADDQAIVLPWASVIVIIVLLNVAFTCATPEAMFFFSRLRTRVASLPMLILVVPGRTGSRLSVAADYFFLPAMALAGPLRVRALVCVRCPRTGRP